MIKQRHFMWNRLAKLIVIPIVALLVYLILVVSYDYCYYPIITYLKGPSASGVLPPSSIPISGRGFLGLLISLIIATILSAIRLVMITLSEWLWDKNDK